MNAIDLLNQQQEAVDALFSQAERTVRLDLRERLFVSIADALAIRATVEERVFYPVVLAEWTEVALRESMQEQFGVKRLIADLLELPATHPAFAQKLRVLKEHAQHQARQERQHLFPQISAVLDAEQLQVIGHDMRDMMTALEGTDARYLVRGSRPWAWRVQPRKKQVA